MAGCIRIWLVALAMILATGSPEGASAQVNGPVQQAAAREKQVLLDTLKQLVEIESESRNPEGLAQIAGVIAERLGKLGGRVEMVEPSDTERMEDTPAVIGKIVRATFTGTGKKKILLIAHMDTVYRKGVLASQPFRIEGNRAYGLGIADDKQGVAVILHAVAMLQSLKFADYGTLTVLINADEEISSPGSRKLLTKAGAEHDAVFSLEGSLANSDKLALATAGIASVTLTVKGRASHAGGAPERGVNALEELSHQIMQMRKMSDPAIGLKLNWTLASAGSNRNVIPAHAQAIADVRVLRVADYDVIEKAVREKIKTQLLPEAVVELTFERRRPPLEATEASRAMGRHAQRVYKEIGRELVVDDVAEGGGTDAAFASLETKSPVLERFGLQGFGAHSALGEYVLIDSIEPRLYLLARMVMDVAQGKTQ